MNVDSSKLAGDIMTTVTQVTDGIKESTGLDINEMLAKGFAKEKAEEAKPVEKNDTGNDYQEVKKTCTTFSGYGTAI